MTGAFVPLTIEGNIIVYRVPASCYPSADDDLAHLAMKPIQWIPEIIGFIFSEDKGFQVSVKVVEVFGSWFLPLGQQYNDIM